MLFADAAGAIGKLDLPRIIMAIGSLGVAAYGVVDATKAFGGGISNRGWGDIKKVVSKLISRTGGKDGPALALNSVLATLRANWLNGMALSDQKGVAKALIKLNLTADNAKAMADATGVDAELLTSIAGKLGVPDQKLSDPETNAFGRFDLLLSSLLDQGYQRADQRYRNSAKMLAVPVAVIIALVGAYIVDNAWIAADVWKACIGGLLATPLAPVAKDLASAIQAGAQLAQASKK